MTKVLRYKRYEIKNSPEKGRIVLARESFHKNEIVVIGRVQRLVEKRTNYSFQISSNVHVDLDEPARLLNHSCNPNLGIQNNIFGGYDFIALKNIRKEDELTWDYCMSEYHSIAVKKCLCGEKSCRKKILGWKLLPENVKRNYKQYSASYLHNQ